MVGLARPTGMDPKGSHFQRYFTENSKKMDSWLHMKIEDIHRELKEIGPGLHKTPF